MTSNKLQYTFSISLGIFFLIIWELFIRVFNISTLVLPSPTVVIMALIKGISSGFFFPHIIQTIYEVFCGLLLGCFMGLGGGLLLGEFKYMRKIFLPFVLFSQVVPKLALAPLFIIWFGFGSLPCIVMTSLICFFPMLETMITAIDNVNVKQVKLFKILGASNTQILFQLKVISSLPYIFSGLKISVVLALVGSIVSEFIGSSKGLGALIIVGQSSMDTPLIFASIAIITFLGLLMYSLISYFELFFLNRRFQQIFTH
jgi:NitT/TauT family transport system permease protein